MSWPNLADLLVAADAEAPVGLVGAPLAAGSVTPGRCDLAPALLRTTLKRIGRYDIGTRLELQSRIADYGNVDIDGLTIEQATAPIREAVAAATARHKLTFLIGGNNAVTRPGVHGLAQSLGVAIDQVGLITLDAHLDMRDTSDGLGNGNPVRALIEDGLPGHNIAQIGLAPWANSKAMHADAVAAGNFLVTLDQIDNEPGSDWVAQALAHVEHCAAIVVDCDIDVIDRAQFPAAPGGRAGGVGTWLFYDWARQLATDPKVRLIDLTEWDPPLDPTDLSALTAARWLAECLAGFERRST